MIEVFKIIHDIYDVTVSPHLSVFLTIRFSMIFENIFFSAHVVNIRNNLPNSAVNASTVNALKP